MKGTKILTEQGCNLAGQAVIIDVVLVADLGVDTIRGSLPHDYLMISVRRQTAQTAGLLDSG